MKTAHSSRMTDESLHCPLAVCSYVPQLNTKHDSLLITALNFNSEGLGLNPPTRDVVAHWWCSVPSAQKVTDSNPTSRHLGTLGKSFTRSCLYDVMWCQASLHCG